MRGRIPSSWDELSDRPWCGYKRGDGGLSRTDRASRARVRRAGGAGGFVAGGAAGGDLWVSGAERVGQDHALSNPLDVDPGTERRGESVGVGFKDAAGGDSAADRR